MHKLWIMKIIKSTTVYVMLSIGVMSNVHADTITNLCKDYEYIAKGLMEHRQQERSKSELLQIADTGDLRLDRIVRAMVLDAYSQHRWSGNTRQQLAVREFGNKWWTECVKNPEMFLGE